MSNINFDRHRREAYADPSPYPDVRVVRPDPIYAALLMDDYAGVISEFTAISQYLYHYFFVKNIDPDLGKLLENVSINEMLHMEILADLIRQLGGNPQIRGSQSTQNHFWNGSFVYYGRDLCDQLKADIDAEYKAIHEYRRHISIIRDIHVQTVLHRIILDEKVHIGLFNQALAKYCDCTYRPLS